MRRAVRERGTVNLIHHATHLKVDIFIAGGTVLDEQQLARRREVVVGPRTYAPRSPPGGHPPSEAALVSRGGELSDRQWRDILGIIRVQGSRLDRPYLDANAPRLHVEDLLARALWGGGGHLSMARLRVPGTVDAYRRPDEIARPERQLRVSARLWIAAAAVRADSNAPCMNELRLVM